MGKLNRHDTMYKLLADAVSDPNKLEAAEKHPKLKGILAKLDDKDKRVLREIALNQTQTPCS